ncbi:MAG: hypothetical protein ACR2PT_13580 [Endozoicomonas sp.]
MSVEARLENLETQHKQLDANQHSLARVCADIKNIALTNQHDIAGLKVDVAEVKAGLEGVKTELDGVKTKLDGVKIELDGVKIELDGVKTELDGVKADLEGVKSNLVALTQATLAGFERTDEKIDQLELLIRQRLPSQ